MRPRTPPPGRVHLFVYGTLRPGLAPAPVRPALRSARTIGPASVAGRLHDLGAYPAAVLAEDPAAPGGGPAPRVRGVLLEIDEASLAALDRYEGVDPAAPAAGLFRRVCAAARLEPPPDAGPNGAAEIGEGWIYVWARGTPPGPVIPTGEWAAPEERGGWR